MAKTTTQVHNGITIETSEPLPSMGGVSGQRGGIIGEVNSLKDGTQYNVPFTLRSIKDLTKIDETSLIYWCARFLLEVAKVPLDVVLVEKGANEAATKKNIIGGIDSTDGQLLGLEAFASCKFKPTQIGVCSYSGVDIANALAGVCDKLYSEGWCNATDTNTSAALALGASLGDTHRKVWCVDVRGERWGHAIPPAIAGMASRLAVKPWETNNGFSLPLDDVAREIGYTINDSGSEGVELNKKGISCIVPDPDGGLMFLGTRTASGTYGNIVGIENQLIRKLIQSHRKTMKYNLDIDFFKARVAQVDNWLKSLKADNALIDANVYLHPERNNLENYKNGTWVLVIDWGAYRPNEHSIIELNQSDAIVTDFVAASIK